MIKLQKYLLLVLLVIIPSSYGMNNGNQTEVRARKRYDVSLRRVCLEQATLGFFTGAGVVLALKDVPYVRPITQEQDMRENGAGCYLMSSICSSIGHIFYRIEPGSGDDGCGRAIFGLASYGSSLFIGGAVAIACKDWASHMYDNELDKNE